MNVGELFVSLGVKGTEKTIGAITGVRDGLKSVASTSLETKAGILAALYALEQLISTSGAQGTSLVNMNAELGVSVDTLQRYQYAARQAGIANETTSASFKTLQSSMTDLLTKGTANDWFPRFAQLTGVQSKDLMDLQQHPDKMILKLQEYYQKEMQLTGNKGLVNKVLTGFGVGNMIPAFARNEFTPQTLAKAPVYTGGEANALDKINIGWSNLSNKFEMDIGKLNAKFGGSLIKDLTALEPKIMGLVNAFAKLALEIGKLGIVGKVFEGWGEIFEGLTEVVEAFSDEKKMAALKTNINTFFAGNEGGIGAAEGALAETLHVVPKGGGEKVAEAMNTKVHLHMKNGMPSLYIGDKKIFDLSTETVSPEDLAKMAEPTAPKPGISKPASAPSNVVNLNPATKLPTPAATAAPNIHHTENTGGKTDIEMNQTLHFHDDGRDATKVADHVGRASKNALRQNPALNRAN